MVTLQRVRYSRVPPASSGNTVAGDDVSPLWADDPRSILGGTDIL